MASVLRRLTSISEIGPWNLSRYSTCQHVSLHRSTSGSLASSRKLRKLVVCRDKTGMLQYTSYNAGAHLIKLPYQSQRCMSILTDLLRRKKRDSTDDAEDEAIPDAKTLPLIEEVPVTLSEEEIEAKRNISRLNIYHQRLVHGEHPYTEPKTWIHHTVKYKRKMFGRYGESSGVNPGILWPTREELEEKIEYENIRYPFTILEMVEKKRAERQKEREAYEARAREVEEKMAMVEKFKEDLAKRHEAKEKEINEAKARREKLVEEVRRHFGFTVDPRDERFQELLAKKEKEQRKNLKEARKMEKQKRILDKLEGKAEKKVAKPPAAKQQEPEDD